MADAYFLFAYNMTIMFNLITKNPFALKKGAYIIILYFAGVDSSGNLKFISEYYNFHCLLSHHCHQLISLCADVQVYLPYVHAQRQTCDELCPYLYT